MKAGQLITGMVLSIIGLALVLSSIFVNVVVRWVMLLYGVPTLIFGVVILLNKGEDRIERIKNQRVNRK